MRVLLPALPLFILTLFSTFADASDRPRQIAALNIPVNVQASNMNDETYRGYFIDLSEIVAAPDFPRTDVLLHQQLDIAESVGLLPHVLAFFHTIPFVVDALACATEETKLQASACYSAEPRYLKRRSMDPTVWDSETHQWTNKNPVNLAEDTKRGVVVVHPNELARYSEEPLLLHELLHAYHNVEMPEGFKNAAVLAHYNDAKNASLYPKTAYVMKNEREFFAVTASVFLYGKVISWQFTGETSKEPFTRTMLKQKHPDYYRYLVWLFGFDPGAEAKATPVASAN